MLGNPSERQFMTTSPDPDAPRTFESALAQLQLIVSQLEDGTLGLEQSLGQFEQGVGLLRNCYQILEQAEQKIEMLTGNDAAGNPVMAPFDGEATFDQDQTRGRGEARGRRGEPGAEAKKPARRRAQSKAPPVETEGPSAADVAGESTASDDSETDSAGPRLF
jgi:exodeoxyribonuclease VII small subunit